MYFILSKILLFLLSPISWVFILLLISLIAKDRKRKRRFLIAATVLLFIFSNTFLFDQFATRWDIPAYHPKKSDSFSCAILLGGFSGVDAQGKGHFTSSADRFIQGIKLLASHKVSHLLITSGNGSLIPDKFREAAWTKTQLEELNFPDSSILIENNSRNTIENARFSKVTLNNSHLKGPYLLVTSAFHMRRAMMIFKKEGIDVIPYSSNFIAGHEKYYFDSFFIPQPENFILWNIYLKEVVGYAVNYFNG
ncbi:MAG: YdcF family protein [Mucilaginibacter sp.]|nr:YdcF family protein [Mucilaginibacter sp.]